MDGDVNMLLFSAAQAGDLAALGACLAAGADPNAADDYGRSPLMVAAGHGHSSCVAALLAEGADPNAFDDAAEWTPLMHAVMDGHNICAQMLLAAGADPNAVDAVTFTALTLAAEHDHSGCIAVLLAAGADPRAAAHNGLTPLAMAAIFGHTDAARLLVRAAPEVAMCDEFGSTPLAMALGQYFIEPRHIDTALCLLEHLPLHEALQQLGTIGAAALPLYAPLVARQPLTTQQWENVPAPCPGLGSALPAVLQRSAAEAGLLVHRLPPADASRLRTFALCLARAQRCSAPLPAPIILHLLLASVAP